MFSLRDSSSAYSSGTDEDSFGWWIGVESHSQKAEPPSSKEESASQQPVSLSSGSAASCTGSDDVSASLSSSKLALARSLAERSCRRESSAEQIELYQLNVEELAEDLESERAVCYTPERLVRSEDYRILTPSPKFYPTLADLSARAARRKSPVLLKDERKIGETHIAALLHSPRRPSTATTTTTTTSNSCYCRCRIRYGDGEVLLHNERCSPLLGRENDRMRLSLPVDPFLLRPHSEYSLNRDGKCSQQPKDDEGLADDTSGFSSVDGRLTETHDDDGWSCRSIEEDYDQDEEESLEPDRRLSDELAYVSFEYALSAREQRKERTSDINEMVSLLSDLDGDPQLAETLLRNEDAVFRPNSHHDCLSRLALTVEPDDRDANNSNLPTATSKDGRSAQEAELEQLRGKVERLQDSNKSLYEEIILLRRDFSKDQWKLDQLSEDISKFRNEVYELRYLDDLLKLLKGELERISNRNWPFVIGHTKLGIEELNLVV